MTIQTTKYVRMPFYVDAVLVTEENMTEVAKWCGGSIQQTDLRNQGLEKYIYVHVHTPMNERQKMAFVGTWVLSTEKGYKVYTETAFGRMFQKAVEVTAS